MCFVACDEVQAPLGSGLRGEHTWRRRARAGHPQMHPASAVAAGRQGSGLGSPGCSGRGAACQQPAGGRSLPLPWRTAAVGLLRCMNVRQWLSTSLVTDATGCRLGSRPRPAIPQACPTICGWMMRCSRFILCALRVLDFHQPAGWSLLKGATLLTQGVSARLVAACCTGLHRAAQRLGGRPGMTGER